MPTNREKSRNRQISRLLAKVGKFMGSGQYHAYVTPTEYLLLIELGAVMPRNNPYKIREALRMETDFVKGNCYQRRFYFYANKELADMIENKLASKKAGTK